MMAASAGRSNSTMEPVAAAPPDAARPRPFQPGTDPRIVWLGGQYGEALDALRASVLAGAGALVLTGDVGSGKTILANTLVERLRSEGVIVGRVDYPCAEPLELFHGIAETYRLPDAFSGRDAFFSSLEGFLTAAHASRRRALLVIEEAQGLGRGLFAEVARVVETGRRVAGSGGSVLSVLLVGQDDIEAILASEEGQDLAAQVTARYRLRALTEDEVAEYVAYRLAHAGLPRESFTPLALRAVAELTRGIPRLINTVCDHALALAGGDTAPLVGVEVVRDCGEDLAPPREALVGLTGPREPGAVARARDARVKHRRRARSSRTPSLIAAAVGVAILALLGGHLLRQSRQQAAAPATGEQGRAPSTQDASKPADATVTAPAAPAPATDTAPARTTETPTPAVTVQTPVETRAPVVTAPPAGEVRPPAATAAPAPRPVVEKRPTPAATPSPPAATAPAPRPAAEKPQIPAVAPPPAAAVVSPPRPAVEKPATSQPAVVTTPRVDRPEGSSPARPPQPPAPSVAPPTPVARPAAPAERQPGSVTPPAAATAPAPRAADEGPDPGSIIDWLLKESPRRIE